MLLAVSLVVGWIGAAAAISGYQAINGKTGFAFTDLLMGNWPGNPGQAPAPSSSSSANPGTNPLAQGPLQGTAGTNAYATGQKATG